MYIFDIKRYAINDGPGIRTTLFLKGCPLRCVWCHNPEGWDARPQLLYKQSKCIGCRTCVGLSPHDAADACPTKAREMCGKEWPMEDLMAEVEKERTIMEDSGGGVTLCGGEPLMHPDGTLELLHELGRRGFHRCVDTTLYARQEVVQKVAEACELLLVDLKLMDPDLHRRYTGVSNELILQNIRWVAEAGHDFFIRIPLIEGINADEANIEQTATFLAALPWQRRTVNLLPYHDVGKDKHRRMQSTYNPQHIDMSTPSDETLQRCAQQLEARRLKVIVGG